MTKKCLFLFSSKCKECVLVALCLPRLQLSLCIQYSVFLWFQSSECYDYCWFCLHFELKQELDLWYNYRVFPAIGKQEGGCCKLTATLLRARRASMRTQDRAQITFRLEMHWNYFKNESGSQLGKGKNQDLVIWAQYTGCPKHDFFSLYWILTTINLNNITFT